MKESEIWMLLASLFCICYGVKNLVERNKANDEIVVVQQEASAVQSSYTLDNWFSALAEVESNHNDKAVGDDGAAIGRLQIHYAYWKDATEFNKSIGGSYEDVRNHDYAKMVVLAYMKRYCPNALSSLDFETLSRVHNAGPRIMSRKGSKAWNNSTVYWKKVQGALTVWK